MSEARRNAPGAHKKEETEKAMHETDGDACK